jgi:hypothetical protein
MSTGSSYDLTGRVAVVTGALVAVDGGWTPQ